MIYQAFGRNDFVEGDYSMLIIEVVKGDITEIDADAIVNPANSLLIMGGGVAGAIKRKGGIEIEIEARKHAPCPVGKAVITSGGKLRARYVIHSPTMEEPAMPTNEEKVRKAIEAALIAAEENNIATVAFPGMGTGVGGLSPEKCADAFIDAIRSLIRKNQLKSIKKIILVAFTDDLYSAFLRVKETLEREFKNESRD